MATTRVFENVLSPADINHILSLPSVLRGREGLSASAQVDFEIDIPIDVRERVSSSLGLDVPSKVPMRWIRGDSIPHADRAWDGVAYETTYLVYLTGDERGMLYVVDKSYPIIAGCGYSFSEGLVHGTRNTTEDRLLLGPFNERHVRVGIPGLAYFRSSALDEIVYGSGERSGTMLSLEELNNRLTAMESGLVATPPGTEFKGWVYASSVSGGVYTIGGAVPVNGTMYRAGTAYSAEDPGYIGVYPLFGPRRRKTIRRFGKGNWPRPRNARGTIAFMV